MRKAFSLLCCTLVSTLLTSCSLGLNATKPLVGSIDPVQVEAAIVYGLVVEDSRNASERFSVTLDEYDIESQRITGNCWRHNRTSASIPRSRHEVQYFVFAVPPGYYVYSAVHANRLENETPIAYLAESGKVAYVGVFTLTSRNRVEVRRDISEPRGTLSDIADDLVLADTRGVEPPGIFLCGP